MSLKHAILAILDVMPLSGYALKHTAFDGSVAHFWPADQAQIYRTLSRLVDDGLVEFEVEESNTPLDKKVYTIRPAGKQALVDWLATSQDVAPYRDPFLIRLYFGYHLSDDQLVELIDDQARQHRKRLDALQAIGQPADMPEMPPDSPFADPRWHLLRHLTLDLGLRLTQTYLDWLADCKTAIRKLSNSA